MLVSKSLFAFAIGFALLVPVDQLTGADSFRLRQIIGMEGSAAKRQSPGAASAKNDSDYDVQRIPVPDGFTGGVAVDVNNRGTVGGVFFTPDNKDITFLWRKGRLTEIRHPSADITSVPSIADSGVLFGNWGSFTEQTAGFYHPATGTWKALPAIPGKPINIGQRANNAGQATGLACAGNWFVLSSCSIWFWNGEAYESPSLPASPMQAFEGINERGQAVGRYLQTTPPIGFRSFVLDRGAALQIILPDTASAAYDINNQGQIVLNFEIDPNKLFVPALYDGGNLELLPLVGELGTTWIGLNERGDISGLAYDDLSSFRNVYPIIGFRK
jgi:hypothetical protein